MIRSIKRTVSIYEEGTPYENGAFTLLYEAHGKTLIHMTFGNIYDKDETMAEYDRRAEMIYVQVFGFARWSTEHDREVFGSAT